MTKGRYNTAAREAIIEFFSENPDRQFTADEVFEGLTAKCAPKAPGKSTVYRLLSQLLEEGMLRRFRDGADSNYLYQHSSKNQKCDFHFHMKCTECGKIYHLECEKSDDLLYHVLSEHGFAVNCSKSMLYGQCQKCKN